MFFVCVSNYFVKLVFTSSSKNTGGLKFGWFYAVAVAVADKSKRFFVWRSEILIIIANNY